MKTRYTEITGTPDQTSEFLLRIKRPIDDIVELAEIALDMFPNNLNINIVLRGSAKDIQDFYRQKYGKDCDYVAFISLNLMTIYVSVQDVNLKVLAHELGHAIVEHYFTERPPYNIHELIAQYCEKNI